MSFRIKIRIGLWGVFVLALVLILYFGIVPSGKISYEYRPGDGNYFIRKITPDDRIFENVGSLKIIGDPVYFSLRTPRRFNKAKVILEFKNDVNPIIETGALVDNVVWRYNLKPAENKIIDDLSGWSVVKDGNTILYERSKKYKSVSDFLDNPPNANEIGTFNYNLESSYKMTNYLPANKESSISPSLRGDYQFFAYLKNEPLKIDFYLSDLNRNKSKDDVDVNIYYKDALVDAYHLDDDGITTDSGVVKPYRKLTVNSGVLPEGAYKIEVKANDDIVTKKIITKLSKISFLNKVWVSEGAGENIALYADAKEIKVVTTNPGRLQNISVDDKKLEITQTYKQFSIKTGGGVSEIKLPKDDVVLAGDGVFSFKKDAFFDPRIKEINENSDLNKDSVNYIITKYDLPSIDNGWKSSKTEIDLSNAYREKGAYSFIVSVPGLRADDNVADDGVEIKSVRVELKGDNVFGLIKKIFRKF